MKRRVFSILPFSVFLLFALNLHGDISYTSSPTVGVDHSSVTKYIDILTGETSWCPSRTMNVYISASFEGVGQGQGTLTNIRVMGRTLATWQNQTSTAGTPSRDGSWTSGTATASASYPVTIPANAKDGASWRWAAGGYTVIWPWKANGTTIKRSANSVSGTISLTVKHICSQCKKSDKSVEALGGKSAHEKITCPEPKCSVQYHKCSPPSGHQICKGCGNRKCDGGDHSYVGYTCIHMRLPQGMVPGCDKKIYECTRSQHELKTLRCGHSMKTCQSG